MITKDNLIKIIKNKKIIVNNIDKLTKSELVKIIELNKPIWKIYDWINDKIDEDLL